MTGKWAGRAILAALALLFALRIVQLKGKGLLHVATPRGSQAPSVTGPLLDGSRFRLADERGHAVALVFWAPWCGPCRAELPGVEMKDLDITITGSALTLKGVRKIESEVPDEKYYRRERGAGPFGRSLELPHKVDTDKVEAVLKDGVLKIRLPKAAEVLPRRIEVKA